ncbi:MAG: NAD(P)H-quinone oxidoreductase [Halioglobus sp.]
MPDISIPEQSRFIAVDPDSQDLRLETGPTPSPGSGDVLIRVEAAGINRADVLQRKGLYPPPEDASPILGLEVAGTVVSAGSNTGNLWPVGEKVCALTHGGGYAEYALAPVGQCLPVPEGYDMVAAAALPEALLTIWHNLYQRARLQPGERVLIHGGASGMGTMGVMMGSALGAEVYTTAGTEEKCKRLQELGATRAINYRTEDFEAVLTELGAANSIDVILDMIGGDYVQKNLNVAAPEGRIVNIAYMGGFKAEVNFAPLLLKRVTMTGSTLRAQSFEQKRVMVQEIIEHVYPHLRNGTIRPIIDSTFALADAGAGHERMLAGEHMGKIILTV